ncbi:hypothetical protein KIW84_011935, partial [Lathyrus oleraceus]
KSSLDKKNHLNQVIVREEEFNSTNPRLTLYHFSFNHLNLYIRCCCCYSENALKIIMESQNNPWKVVEDKRILPAISVNSVVLCFLLIIIPALKMSLFGDKMMTDHIDSVKVISMPIVVFFQVMIFLILESHPVNKNVIPILYILVLLTATTVIQMGIAATILDFYTLIVWVVLIAMNIYRHWEEVCKVDRVVLSRIRIFIAIISIISLIWNCNSIFQSVSR